MGRGRVGWNRGMREELGIREKLRRKEELGNEGGAGCESRVALELSWQPRWGARGVRRIWDGGACECAHACVRMCPLPV